MKDTLYIAVTGVHGSGKTTLCGKLAAAIPELGLDVTVGEEVARECPYPVGLETTREAQDWIYDAHYEMEMELRGEEHDVVIFDRTILDNVLYAMRYIGIRGGHLDMPFTDTMDEAQRWLHSLDYDLVIRTHHVRLRVSDDPEFTKQMEGLFDVFMAAFVDVDVLDVRNTDVIQTTVKWVEENL
jgi:nicotinamide riboside kinase